MQELFLAEDSDRLKLMVLYSGEEDEKLRRAASGTLAMLTALHPPICKRIPQVVSAWGGGSLVCPPPCVLGLAVGWGPAAVRHPGAQWGAVLCLPTVLSAPLCPQTVHWLEILQALLLSPSTELQHRGAVVVMNMMAAERGVAEQLIASEMLEILSVLAKDRDKPRVAQAAQEALAQAVSYGLIKPGPGQD